MKRFAGKTAVIVGGSRGIGRGIAIAFADEGADVVVVARAEGGARIAGDPQFPGALGKTVEEITAGGGHAVGMTCDIGSSAEVNGLVDGVVRRFGRLDVLVNSAVYINYDKVLDCSDEAWDVAFDVNAKGAFYLTRAAAPPMIAQGGGHIMHLTGLGARELGAVNAITGGSKAALERFVRGAADELKAQNVAINLLDPGGVKTERSVAVRGEAFDWGAFATPEDIGPAAVHLALQDAATMTGQIYRYQDYVGGNR